MRRGYFALGALLLATVVYAAASQGLKWNASVTYDDGTPIEATQKVVYLVYDSAGKQVASTFALTVAGSALPVDGCYFLRAALYAQDTNSVVPGSQSDPSATVCTKAPQKRVAIPTGVGAQ